MPEPIEDFDVVISGAGIVGRTLALALADAGAGRVAIVDRQSISAPATGDRRSSAIAAAVARMLDTLDVWPSVEGQAQPINRMDVTDSHLSEPIRPVFLTFDGVLPDGGPFAFMVPNDTLTDALQRRLAEMDVTIHENRSVTGLSTDGKAVLTLDDGTRLRASLVVGADGGWSPVRGFTGIRTVGWDYDQFGLVTEIEHENPHDGRAEEHFLPSGPFAILPLRGNRSSLVWTERSKAARQLLALDRDALKDELMQRVPPHYGTCRIDGRVQSFPLKLLLARDYTAPGVALVGDAAHVIHPLAGQGLNLGLRDAAALAEVVTDAVRLGLDPGSLAVLESYQRWRRFDVVQMAAVTDVLNRLFGTDIAPIRMLRDVGMGLVDRLPALKRAFIGEAAGGAGNLPRLLKGEVL